MARLEIFLFGSPRIELDGTLVEVDTRKAVALVAYLAMADLPVGRQAGAQPVAAWQQRDRLAALLWPDYEESNARGALRRTLSTLNKALAGQHIEITRESVRLSVGPHLWLDVAEFHRRLAACAAHGHSDSQVCPDCLPELKAAAQVYHAPFMAGFTLRDSASFDEWQFFQEEGLRRELNAALDRLALGCSATGEHMAAIEYARRRLALDTLNEEAHRQLMLLYAQAGQASAALRQYRECVRILDEELGVPPLEDTTQLYNAILSRAPLPAADERWVPARQQSAQSGESRPVESVSYSPAVQRPPNRLPMVGRSAELQALLNGYAALAGAQPAATFAALTGEAGIGKTRLAEAFTARVHEQGAVVLRARCYQGEAHLAYGPFIALLNAAAAQPRAAERLAGVDPAWRAEAARLVPLPADQPEAAPLDSPGAQMRFFEGLRQVITVLLSGSPGAKPGVLFLDDLHWADAASLDLLTYLARRLAGFSGMILAAWRSEPGEISQRLDRLAAEVQRTAGERGQPAVVIRLNRLTLDNVVELVRGSRSFDHSHSETDQASLGRRLYEESEGVPLVAAAYLENLALEPDLEKAWEMPGNVRDLLHARLAGLDDAARQLLSTSAVIGRSFDYATLREASGRSEIETVNGLEALLSAGLITERTDQDQTGADYDFTHEKLRALVYDETSLARRRLLHRRVAEALQRPTAWRESGPGAGPAAAVIAHHYHQAGLNEPAAELYRQAGEQARRLFANVEALAHFQSALAANHPDRANLHEAIGDLHTLSGEYGPAIASYETAAALCSPGCMSGLEHKLGQVFQRRGDWELAELHYRASLEALGPDPDPADEARLLADLSLTAHARGQTGAAQQMAEKALATAGTQNSRAEPIIRAQAQANNVLGILARADDRMDTAIHHLEASLQAAGALEDLSAQIAALNNLALVYGENQQYERAIALAERALALVSRQGDRHREAALHNNLADLLHRSGREAEAMQQLKQAVMIFSEIGGEAPAPEIWKLTEW